MADIETIQDRDLMGPHRGVQIKLVELHGTVGGAQWKIEREPFWMEVSPLMATQARAVYRDLSPKQTAARNNPTNQNPPGAFRQTGRVAVCKDSLLTGLERLRAVTDLNGGTRGEGSLPTGRRLNDLCCHSGQTCRLHAAARPS